MKNEFDAVMIISFGGPEGMADVMPFLDNVLKGKNVPEARKKDVARHYGLFEGVSPINAQNRELKTLLEKKLKEEGIDLPVYWGNRNWKPYIKDALLEMKQAGVKHALGYITSAFESYSGAQQYLEDIAGARTQIEEAPEVSKLKAFFDHPYFIQVNAERIQNELNKLPSDNLKNVHIAFTAHSIPISMSEVSPYVAQLQQTCQLVVDAVGIKNWKLVYQSGSASPDRPWLTPDINEHLQGLSKQGIKTVIVSPIGFVSDHMEVMYDLDIEAKKTAEDFGIQMLRAKSPGNHPLYVKMIVDLIKERLNF
jgi:ferrochelatase